MNDEKTKAIEMVVNTAIYFMPLMTENQSIYDTVTYAKFSAINTADAIIYEYIEDGFRHGKQTHWMRVKNEIERLSIYHLVMEVKSKYSNQ